MQYDVEVGDRVRRVQVQRREGRFVVALDGRRFVVDALRIDPQTLSLLIEMPTNTAASTAARAGAPPGRVISREATLARDPVSGRLAVGVEAVPSLVAVNGRRRSRSKDDGAPGAGPQRVVAPMPGRIVRVLVKKGDQVAPRQPLVVVEAMKMENELRAAAAGVVGELQVREGQSVDAGALLAVIVPA